MVRRIVHLRWKHRLGPVQIADRLAIPSSTVRAVLVRCRLNRLSHIDRATGEPIRRYEHQRPGDLLHVDVKKLGNVPDRGGWRYPGRHGWAFKKFYNSETPRRAALPAWLHEDNHHRPHTASARPHPSPG